METDQPSQLLKIVIHSARPPANVIPSQKPRQRKAQKLIKAAISVCIENELGQSLGKQFEFKTTTLAVKDSAVWNQSCLFALDGNFFLGFSKFKLVFRLLEMEDELGVVYYGLDYIRNIDLVEPEDLKLTPMGSLKVQIGWFGQDGRLHGSSKNLERRHPHRASREIQDMSHPDGITQSPSWGKISVSEQSRNSRRQILKDKEGTPGFTGRVSAFAGGDGRKILELEKSSEESAKILQEKNAEIVRLQEEIKDVKSIIFKKEIPEKNPEITKLQKKIEETKRILQSKTIRCKQLESVVSRYQDIDDDARKLIVPTSIPGEKTSEEKKTSEQKGGGGTSLFSLKKGKNVDRNKIPDAPEGYAAFLSTNEELELLPEIKTKFSKSEALWLIKFLAAGGFESIHSLLIKIEAKSVPDTSLMIKESHLISLIRVILNHPGALVVALKQYRDGFTDIAKLTLLSKNSLAKAETCMMLAGLCLYGRTYHKLVQGIVKFVAKSPRPYFVLVKSLREERDRGLMTACMTFINALIAGETELNERMKIRAVFLDAGILMTMDKQTKQYQSEKPLLLQFTAFENLQKRDQEKLKDLRYVGVLDLHNPQVVFNRVMRQAHILGVDRLVNSVLQHMLLVPEVTMDGHEGGSNTRARSVLSFVERATRRVAFPEEPQAIGQLTYEELHLGVFKLLDSEEKKSGKNLDSNSWLNVALVEAPMAPPQPGKNIQEPAGLPSLTKVKEGEEDPVGNFDDQSVPAPRKEMRHFYWDKISDNEPCPFWEKLTPDLAKMENMFPKLEEHFYATKSSLPTRIQAKKSTKIALLPVHIANNISILRSNFGNFTDVDIIKSILNVRDRPFGTAQLEALLKCVPTDDNMIEALLRYEGDMEDLREAERFSLTLLTIDNVGDLLQSLIFYDEFDVKVSSVQQHLSLMKCSCEEILTNEKLQGILTILLAVGELLTYGLQHDTTKLGKLVQLKVAKNPRYNLADFISEYIDEQYDELSIFYGQLKNLEEAVRYQPNLTIEEITYLKQRVNGILDQMELTPLEFKGGAYADYYELMEQFLQNAGTQLAQLEEEFQNFEQFGSMVLQAFGYPPEGALVKLLDYLHLFSKKFRDIAWERKMEWQDFYRFKKLGLTGDQSKSQAVGVLDQLVEAITRGDFSVVEKVSTMAVPEEPQKQPNPPDTTPQPEPPPHSEPPTETDKEHPLPDQPDIPKETEIGEAEIPPVEEGDPFGGSGVSGGIEDPFGGSGGMGAVMNDPFGEDDTDMGPNVDDVEALLADSSGLTIDDLLKDM